MPPPSLPANFISPATDEGLIARNEATVTAATRRKSSTWKAFNIKKQLIKVDSRLRNTFVTAASPEPAPPKSGSTFYTDDGPTDNPSSGLPFAHNDRNDYLEQIESEIVQSLNEAQASGNDESIADATDSLVTPGHDQQHQQPPQQQHQTLVASSMPRSILNTTNSNHMSEQHVASSAGDSSSPINKKVEFSEEPTQRVAFVMPSEGALVSRPADLPLTASTADDDRPVPPPRISKFKNNKQRLLSVPNIKLAKQQQTQPEFPMRGKMSVGHKDSLSNVMSVGGGGGAGGNVVSAGNHNSAGGGGNNNAGASSSFANSFMRRFSKYQLRDPSPTKNDRSLTVMYKLSERAYAE